MDSNELIGWANYRFKSVQMGGYFSLLWAIGSLFISAIGNNNDLDLPLTIFVITGAMFSMILVSVALDDLAALVLDAKDLSETNFGKTWSKTPLAVLKTLTIVSNLAVATAIVAYLYK